MIRLLMFRFLHTLGKAEAKMVKRELQLIADLGIVANWQGRIF